MRGCVRYKHARTDDDNLEGDGEKRGHFGKEVLWEDKVGQTARHAVGNARTHTASRHTCRIREDRWLTREEWRTYGR